MQVSFIRVAIECYRFARGVVQLVDSVTRIVIYRALWLSSFVLPNQFYNAVLWVRQVRKLKVVVYKREHVD